MKLSWRILLIILVSISLSAAANIWLTTYQARTLHNDSEKLLANTVVRSLRKAVVRDVIDGNRLRVSNLLKSLVTQDDPIQFLYISTNSNKIFAHSFNNDFPRYLLNRKTFHPHFNKVELSAKYQTQSGLIYEYSVPLITGLDSVLHIGINQSDIATRLNNNQMFILLMSALVIIFSILFAFLWSRLITGPLTAFSEQIQMFGEGKETDFSPGKSAPLEIKQLAHAMQTATEDRYQALVALQKREQDLAITLNSIGDAVITTDAAGNVTRMNPVAEQLTGWTINEAREQSLKEVFPIINASTHESIENPVDKVIKTGETVYLSNHTTLIAKDGSEYQIADSAAPIRDVNNAIVGMVLVFNDVTEQYMLRQTAAKNKKDLQAIMDNSPSIIYVKDLKDRFTFVNQQFTRLFEIDLEEVIGKTLHDIFPEDVADEVLRNDKDVQMTEQMLESEESVTINKLLHTYHSTKFPLRDSENKVYAICSISTDITERKLKDEQLRRSQKMDALGKLTGGIAHDFNNMLGVILGYSELLTASLKDDNKLNTYIQEIHRAGERGAKLTKKLLSFSRQRITDSKIIDINRLLVDQRDMLEKTLTARIKLNFELADNLWPVLLDNSDLEDAIVNISINAMHAIDGNGQLTIKTYNETVSETDSAQLNIPIGDYVLLSITDTGKGMDNSTLEKIFDPFFTTKGEHGTGLGLSQVYGFVNQTKGAVNVYSEPGHGTRITLYFPRKFEPGETLKQKTAKNETNITLTGNETILVVDDEPALVKLTSNILQKHGYRILTAANGKQALEVLKKETIDLMLSDVIMPEMDGYELAKKVQEQYPLIKIQMASGFSDDRHEDMTDDSLHANLLHKPYHSQTLLKNIRILLDS